MRLSPVPPRVRLRRPRGRYERELRQLRAELEERSRNVVDKRWLLEVEEQKRKAEQDKLAAITELEKKSREFIAEKQAKRALEERIAGMQSQMLTGGQKIEDTPAFRSLLMAEHKRIRNEYESKLQELEAERQGVEEDKSQVGRYKVVLLKQRDIMIALTARLNERDEQIGALQEELEAYDAQYRRLEDALDAKTAELIALRRAAMQSAAGSPGGAGNEQLLSALGAWGGAGGAGGAGAAGEQAGDLAERFSAALLPLAATPERFRAELRGLLAVEMAARGGAGGAGPSSGEGRAQARAAAPLSRRRTAARVPCDTHRRAAVAVLKLSAASRPSHPVPAQGPTEVGHGAGPARGSSGHELAEQARPHPQPLPPQARPLSPALLRKPDPSLRPSIRRSFVSGTQLSEMQEQHGQFRQEVVSRIEEKNALIRRVEEENRLLRQQLAARPPEAEAAALREQCENHQKERAALKTILENKARLLRLCIRPLKTAFSLQLSSSAGRSASLTGAPVWVPLWSAGPDVARERREVPGGAAEGGAGAPAAVPGGARAEQARRGDGERAQDERGAHYGRGAGGAAGGGGGI